MAWGDRTTGEATGSRISNRKRNTTNQRRLYRGIIVVAAVITITVRDARCGLAGYGL